MNAFWVEDNANPYPSYDRLRAQGALVPHLLDDVPVTLVTRYDECAQVLTGNDWGHGYSAGISPFRDTVAAIPGSFVRMDPPEHGRLRGLVNKAFTPRTVADMVPLAQGVVDTLVTEGLANGSIDVLNGLAVPLAVAMIPGRLLGAPVSDAHLFRRWQLAIARGSDPDHLLSTSDIEARGAAAQECLAYFAALIAEKKANPTNDLLSELIAVEQAGDQLAEREVLGLCVLLLVAGMETSINLIGNGMLALLRDPAQLELLRARPELMASAIDEMLRYDAPTQFTIRVALSDTVVGDREFKRGDGVVVLTASASRDPLVYEDADALDITRYEGKHPARRHLGFSLGLHYCVGAPLARIEAEAAFRTLLDRAPALTLAADSVEYQPSLIHRGILSLPVKLG
ncbi:cytochrome P450 [Actinokineospora sp. NBRC 105648]|uniref:cytochrome P450 n=1 Tax=Actinokineospora sp. NBRC 105648 TaxID=3032206 RepID=UPI0024A4DF77|nr:cytochrome P450 [Actinokineospora sp. NBRC 105648]GLZ36518.1 cytochrome P450 [Actinokineospora sp. NBRC 105648]